MIEIFLYQIVRYILLTLQHWLSTDG